MAAFPTARAHAHLPGQGSVEFILIMPVLLTFLFAIGSFAMLSYQNTVIQHSLATLADALPAGWQEQDRNELVRDLVCDGTDLDKSRLTVTNARVVNSDPPRVFDREAIRSIERATYRPRLENGTPVGSTLRRRIEFKLNG